jgi:hypothetical protein
MDHNAIQDSYPEELSYCYGCARLNEHGLQIKIMWDVDETIPVYTPKPYHIAIPGYVYGGLTASHIDYHGTSTAAYRNAGQALGSEPTFRFVIATLQVNFLHPTPLGVPLTLQGKIVYRKTLFVNMVFLCIFVHSFC